jgi:hypothetical protein
MTTFVDYNQLQDDFKTAVEGGSLGFKTVLEDANLRDFLFDNMPLLDIRVKEADPQATTNKTYYVPIVIECEISAYSLVSRRDAAILRGQLVDALQRFVKDHPRFSSGIETTTLGKVNFGSGEDKAQGAFVAGAVLEFNVYVYAE